jgi:hypothetical protein
MGVQELAGGQIEMLFQPQYVVGGEVLGQIPTALIETGHPGVAGETEGLISCYGCYGFDGGFHRPSVSSSPLQFRHSGVEHRIMPRQGCFVNFRSGEDEIFH